MVVLTGILWFFARPGGDRKWKLACANGYAAAALGYVIAFVIHHVYDRARPYEAHPTMRHPWSSSTDASFPSDHTSLSFAIAFAVLMFDTVAGVVFLVVAALIAVGRLFIGAHYPGDVLAGRRCRRSSLLSSSCGSPARSSPGRPLLSNASPTPPSSAEAPGDVVLRPLVGRAR